MISIPCSLSFAKLVMMSSTLHNLQGMPDKRPKIHAFTVINVFLYNLDSSLYKEWVLSGSKAINYCQLPLKFWAVMFTPIYY